ncbi:MAG: acyl carrier protein [Chthoniobacteraceae bacterium]
MDTRLRQLLARVFKVAPESLTPDSGPHTIPAWDSAAHMNLIIELEKEFSVQFSDDEVVDLVSIEAIAQRLAKS